MDNRGSLKLTKFLLGGLCCISNCSTGPSTNLNGEPFVQMTPDDHGMIEQGARHESHINASVEMNLALGR